MTEIQYILLINFTLLMAAGFLVWLLSLKLKDAGIADIYWGTAFIIAALSSLFHTAVFSVPNLIITGITLLWGSRLALHIGLRHRGQEEDKRYQAMRKRTKNFPLVSLPLVFILQSFLAYLVSFSLQWGVLQGNRSLSFYVYAGSLLALSGLALESIADWQLQKFRISKRPGEILNRGLWKYSRHPNYFGESLVWWGLFITVLDVPYGIVTIFSPLLITFLLLKVSGVSLLEKHMGESFSKEYEEYKRRTSPFIPWFPRKEAPEQE